MLYLLKELGINVPSTTPEGVNVVLKDFPDINRKYANKRNRGDKKSTTAAISSFIDKANEQAESDHDIEFE
jgi:hypothetical protein